MKRICILICFCMIVGLFGACGTENEAHASVSVFDPVGTEDAQPAETSTQPEEPVLSTADQVALIARERGLWLPDEEWYFQPYSYAITDLNQNGRVEILVSCCQGTDIFTLTDVFEVSENGDSLIRCNNSQGEGASQADLIVSKAPVYYNAEENSYTYLFYDYMRSGWAWNGEEARAVTLLEGQLVEQLIAGMFNEYDEEANCTSEYYRADGASIDEAAYQTAVAEYFKECVEMEALFAWQNIDYDEAYAMDAEAWSKLLEASYTGFSVN